MAVRGLLFLVLGVAALLPWNALITEVQFFQHRLCGHALRESFLKLVTVVYLLCDVAAATALLFTLHAFTEGMLVVGPLLKSVLGFSLMAALAVLPQIQGEAFIGITMWVVILSGLIKSLLVAGCAALANRIGTAVDTSMFLSGMAAAGVATSLASLITTAAVPQPEDFCASSLSGASHDDTSGSGQVGATGQKPNSSSGDDEQCPAQRVVLNALFYFLSAVGISLLGVATYFYLSRLSEPERQHEHHHHHHHRHHHHHHQQHHHQYLRQHRQSDPSPKHGRLPRRETADEEEAGSDIDHDDHDDERQATKPSSICRLIAQLHQHLAAITICTIASLMVFPSVIAVIHSGHRCDPSFSRFRDDLFTPSLFLVFNLADLLGRAVAGNVDQVGPRTLLMASLGRIPLLPAIWACNVPSSYVPTILSHDFFPFSLTFMLGLSNGFIVCACFTGAPSRVSKANQGLASTIMIFGLNLGLLGGSALSFASMRGIPK